MRERTRMSPKPWDLNEKRAQILVSRTGTVTANLLTWITVYGNVCLALRHPQNKGPSRGYAVEFVKKLGRALVEWGALTEEELKDAEKLEREEGARDIGGL